MQKAANEDDGARRTTGVAVKDLMPAAAKAPVVKANNEENQQFVQEVKARATQHFSVAYNRASSNVSKHLQDKKTQQFGSSALAGLLLGHSVYYRFYRFAAFLATSSYMYGLPSSESMQVALDKVRTNGLAEVRAFNQDVTVGFGMAAGVIFSCFHLGNVATCMLAYLAYAASGL